MATNNQYIITPSTWSNNDLLLHPLPPPHTHTRRPPATDRRLKKKMDLSGVGHTMTSLCVHMKVPLPCIIYSMLWEPFPQKQPLTIWPGYIPGPLLAKGPSRPSPKVLCASCKHGPQFRPKPWHGACPRTGPSQAECSGQWCRHFTTVTRLRVPTYPAAFQINGCPRQSGPVWASLLMSVNRCNYHVVFSHLKSGKGWVAGFSFFYWIELFFISLWIYRVA